MPDPRPDHIVLTSIAAPPMLHELRDHLAAHGDLERVTLWFVADRKTPDAARTLCDALRDRGLDCRYLDIAAQNRWGHEHVRGFYARLPYNNESRRNIGYLMAMAEGCERLIVLDDDNFPAKQPMMPAYRRAGASYAGPVVHEPSGYFNVCEDLVSEPARLLFPRGYPFRRRGGHNAPRHRPAPPGCRIGVNAGLWLSEPDIDATTWLNGKVRATGYAGPDPMVLDHDTWSPINTQNTAVARALIPAFLCVPMGRPMPGGRIERYGDIWAGYFLQTVIAGTDWRVAFGQPLVDHRRNPHDYLADLRHEFWGMQLTDWLLDKLRASFAPVSSAIEDRVRELADAVQRFSADVVPAYPAEAGAFLVETADTLRDWIDAIEHLQGGSHARESLIVEPRTGGDASRRDAAGPLGAGPFGAAA